jgi:hypothetical protein
MPPGVVLAALTARAWDGSARVSDDELIGIARAWRRLSSWVAAGELAAIAELAARRDAQVAAGADPHIAEHVTDEVAAALTLTSRSADHLVDFAVGLAALPATRAALARGDIDRARAAVICDETTGLDPRHAAAVEEAVIGRADGQTTGQLRAATRRAVLAADPAAASRRREEAQKEARVETWDERSGTAALAGRDLPPADVLAADRRIDAFARQLKTAGATGTLDALRARVYTALLLGIPIQTLHAQLLPPQAAAPGPHQPPAARLSAGQPGGGKPDSSQPGSGEPAGGQPGGPGPAGDPGPAGPPGTSPAAQPGSGEGLASQQARQFPGPPLAGSVNLTMPLSTWLGGSAPGDVPGFGPIPATDAQALARLLAAQPGTRWCLTLTGSDGAALAHGCARAGARSNPRGQGQHPGPPGPAQPPELTFTIGPLARKTCQHEHEGSGYRPSDHLRHLIVIRQPRCSFPGCRRAATRCDLDHTVPFDQGGRTCECGLAPLCRRHHQAKQAEGWQLDQPEPGVLIWTLPHGRSYRVRPDPYPADGP